MKLDALKTKMVDMAKEIQIVRQRMRDAAKTELAEVFSDIFKEHPEVQVIMWTQYTPYFNDGDTCIFGVNEVAVSTDPNWKDKAYWDLIDEAYSRYNVSKPDSNDVRIVIAKELEKLFHSMEDTMEDMFGDHVQVTVTRKGIDTEEYEHD